MYNTPIQRDRQSQYRLIQHLDKLRAATVLENAKSDRDVVRIRSLQGNGLGLTLFTLRDRSLYGDITILCQNSANGTKIGASL